MTTKKTTRRKATPKITVKTRKLYDGAKLPTFGSKEAACADLYAAQGGMIPPRGTMVVKTGIAFELPKNTEALIRPRSGHAAKYGITVLNTPGTIDPDYRGEVMVILYNAGSGMFRFEAGTRIAQVAVRRFDEVVFEEVEELTDTERGNGGMGSTGE